MTTISNTFTFEAAHRLMDYHGTCSNIHGHHFKVIVHLSGPLDKEGFVMDFICIKAIVDRIIKNYDHALILNPLDEKLIEFCYDQNYKLKIMQEGNPTAENLAHLIYKEIFLAFNGKGYASLEKVEVYETEDAKADYTNK